MVRQGSWLLHALCCLALAGCAGGPDKSNPTAMKPLELPTLKSPAAETQDKSARPKAGDLSKPGTAGAEKEPAKEKGKTKAEEISRAQALMEYNRELANGRELERLGKPVEARAVYERLITAYPRRCEAYHRLAVVADGQRRYPEAQALYTQAIRLNNRNPDLFNDLGYCFYLQGKLSKAETAILKAVAMRPAEARYRNNLGLIYGQQGHYDEALDQFRRGGGEGDAFYNLAFIRASQNDMEGAKECFLKALAADSTHEKARRALASFERAETDPEGTQSLAAMGEEDGKWISYVEDTDSKSAVVRANTSSTAPGNDGVVAAGHSAPQGLAARLQTPTAKNAKTFQR